MIFDLGIESVTDFGSVAYYDRIWTVEFRDYSTRVVLEDAADSPTENYVLEPVED